MPAAHLEHDPVELEAQQQVPHVAAGEAELVAARQVEVDPAHGQEGPVAHDAPGARRRSACPSGGRAGRRRRRRRGRRGSRGRRRRPPPRRPRAGSPRPPRAPSAPRAATAAATTPADASPTTIGVRPSGAAPTATGIATPKWSATSSASRRPGYWARASPGGTTIVGVGQEQPRVRDAGLAGERPEGKRRASGRRGRRRRAGGSATSSDGRERGESGVAWRLSLRRPASRLPDLERDLLAERLASRPRPSRRAARRTRPARRSTSGIGPDRGDRVGRRERVLRRRARPACRPSGC